MGDILCNISAFRFHRVPPQVQMLLPMLPTPELDRDRSQLSGHPLVTEVLACPVHLLFNDSARSHAGNRVVNHVWSGDMPKGAVIGTPFGVEVADPLFTLLTMAPSMSEYLLTMAMYEFCGTFSVFQPTPLIERLLERTYAEDLLDSSFGWRRMVDATGKKTNLWERPPFVEAEQLQRYADCVSGMRGSKKFKRSAASVTGVTASPFEAQASMIFGMSRRLGGWGLKLENNVELSMNRSARLVSGRGKRIADIIVTNSDGGQSVILECQSHAFHSSAEARIADSDRTTALQSMGYQVIQVSHAQIRDSEKCAVLIRLIERLTGSRHRGKTRLQQERETKMRREIFVPWELF